MLGLGRFGVPAQRRGCQLLRFLGNQIGHLGQHIGAGRFDSPATFHRFFFERFKDFIFETRNLLNKHELVIELTTMLADKSA